MVIKGQTAGFLRALSLAMHRVVLCPVERTGTWYNSSGHHFLQVFRSSRMTIRRHGGTIGTTINRSTVSLTFSKVKRASDDPSIAKSLRKCCVRTLLLKDRR